MSYYNIDSFKKNGFIIIEDVISEEYKLMVDQASFSIASLDVEQANKFKNILSERK